MNAGLNHGIFPAFNRNLHFPPKLKNVNVIITITLSLVILFS